MTLGDQLRRQVGHVINVARSRAAGGGTSIRVVRPANVVVARNIGARGGTREASARQTVVAKDGAVHEHTERSAVRTSGPSSEERSPEHDGQDRHA
jgi:hypothetical protein